MPTGRNPSVIAPLPDRRGLVDGQRRDREHHVAGREDVAVDDLRTGLAVVVVSGVRVPAGACLDDDLEPRVDQGGHGCGDQRHAALAGTPLGDHPDSHSGST